MRPRSRPQSTGGQQQGDVRLALMMNAVALQSLSTLASLATALQALPSGEGTGRINVDLIRAPFAMLADMLEGFPPQNLVRFSHKLDAVQYAAAADGRSKGCLWLLAGLHRRFPGDTSTIFRCPPLKASAVMDASSVVQPLERLQRPLLNAPPHLTFSQNVRDASTGAFERANLVAGLVQVLEPAAVRARKESVRRSRNSDC